MKSLVLVGFLSVGLVYAQSPRAPQQPPLPVQSGFNAGPANPAIDMEAYIKTSQEAARHRSTRRLTEEQFIKMSQEPGTVILDARSKDKFELLHIKGAVNLNFSDITVESLQRMLPDKNARILIYCNNNFKNAEQPFPSKLPVASLNISTYITLYNYGYRNVYELGPQIDPKQSKLPFESKTGR